MKATDFLIEDDEDVTLKTLKGELPGPFKVIGSAPPSWKTSVRVEPDNPNNWKYKRVDWRPKGLEQNVFVTVKQTESSGDAPAILKNLGYLSGFKNLGIVSTLTLDGRNVKDAVKKVGYNGFKPSGLVFVFAPGKDQNEAVQKVMSLLSNQLEKKKKENVKKAKWKAGAADRKKEASKAYAKTWKEQRQKLYDKYGKRNVDSVTAKQIGGDDGYQWYILVNGQPVTSNMMALNVPYAKLSVYDQLLKKNGKV